MAFVKTIKRGERTYYYLVESIRDGKRVRQRYLEYLGTEKPIPEKDVAREESDMAVSTQVIDFWSTLARMYKDLDLIRQTSHKIIDYARQIDAFDTYENFDKALKREFDATELKQICSNVQKELNSILSYSHELHPHLKNPSLIPALSNQAHLLLMLMELPEQYMVLKLKEISLGLKMFAQSSNKFILSPSKKSIKYAFGIDVGNEWVKLKAYIERHYSNY